MFSILKISLESIQKEIEHQYCKSNRSPKYCIMSEETKKLIQSYIEPKNIRLERKNKSIVCTIYGVQVLINDNLNFGEFEVVG